jgi:hypothetical protein
MGTDQRDQTSMYVIGKQNLRIILGNTYISCHKRSRRRKQIKAYD